MNKAELVAINAMPDVASHELHAPAVALDWVGMSDIHQPLLVRDGNQIKQVQSRVQVFVDLGDPLAKGIHMSRLYLILDEHAETRPLTAAGLKLLLLSILESHRDLSNQFTSFRIVDGRFRIIFIRNIYIAIGMNRKCFWIRAGLELS